MKIMHLAIAATSVLLAQAGPSVLPGEFIVLGFTSPGPHVAYSIWWTNLPASISWQPDAQPFPIDPAHFVELAIPHLQDALTTSEALPTTRFIPNLISIRRLWISPVVATRHGRAAGDITNQWLVAVTFSGVGAPNPTVPLKRVVMLLDGTFAKERLQSPSPHASAAPAPRMAMVSNSAEYLPSTVQVPTDPYSELRSPHFDIPRQRWDPQRGEFPLELGAASRLAADVLRTKLASRPSLLLAEVEVSSYVPSEAMKLRGEAEESGHNWLTVFTFEDSRHSDYKVNMLLDGRVLSTITPLSKQSMPTAP